MKDEFLNMKDVIIKHLQDENELLCSRCSKLEDKVVWLELSVNQVEQYGRKNNIVITGIPDNIADDELDAVTSIMEDVDVIIQIGDIGACHRNLTKTPDKNLTKKLVKKAIVRFVNCKCYNKALIKRRNLINMNSEMK